MRKRIIFILLAVFVSMSANSHAELGLGVGYPYVSLKLTPGFFHYLSLEGKYAFGEGINIFAGRGYFNFINQNNLRMFGGYEMGHITFEYDELTGNGREYGMFLGMEIRFATSAGLTLDISPTLIEVNSQNVGLQEMDWVANIALYLYLF